MRLRLSGLGLAVVLSGAAALVYEVVWTRMLHAVLGVSDLAVASVLAAFFLGLGLGSLVASRVAPKLSQPALAYALIEVAIGLYAFASVLVLPNLHSLYAELGRDMSFGALTAMRLGLALLVLVVPTTLLGASLPLLVETVARMEKAWARHANTFYALNTLGAAGGAAFAGFYGIFSLGLRETLAVGATGSLGAAAVAVVTFGLSARHTTLDESEIKDPLPPVSQEGMRLGIALAAATGMLALAGEVVFTRVLRIIVQGTTSAFAAMLVNYLVGIALGAGLAERFVRRGGRPKIGFVVTQSALAIAVLGAISLTAQLPRLVGPLEGARDLTPHHVSTVLVLSALLLFPIATLSGASLPLLLRAYAPIPRLASSFTGKLLSANTVFGLIGAILAGFTLVPALGVEKLLLGIAGLHALVAAAALTLDDFSKVRLAVSTVALALFGTGIALSPPSLALPFLLDARNEPVDAIIEGPARAAHAERLQYLEEGRSTTVTLVDEESVLRLYNDGRPESGLASQEPVFGTELALLGTLPAILSERRETALAVGLGAGHSVSGLLAGPYRHIEVVELEPAVVRAARKLHRDRHRRFALDDRRATLVIDDARAHIALTEDDVLDAVVSQPSHPWLVGSSALYTVEFFRDVHRVLRPTGVFVLWVNLFRNELRYVRAVVHTLLQVFPEVQAFRAEHTSLLLVASEEPRPLDASVRVRLERERALSEFLAPHGLDQFLELVALREMGTEAARAFSRGGETLTDDHPMLEAGLARLSASAAVRGRDLDYAVRDQPFLDAAAIEALEPRLRTSALGWRIDFAGTRPHALDRLALTLPHAALAEADQRYLEGRIAEARGDLPGALRAYDGAGTSRAASAADALRLAERKHAEAVARASARSVVPETSDALLRHAAAIGTREAAQAILTATAMLDDPAAHGMRVALQAFADAGCAGLLAIRDEHTFDDEHFAWLGERCAIEVGDPVRAAAFAERRSLARRVRATEENQRGNEARDDGNPGAAERAYRRCLSSNPAHGGAASSLAKLLVQAGRRDAAQRVLRDTYVASRGLSVSINELQRAAGELHLALPTN